MREIIKPGGFMKKVIYVILIVMIAINMHSISRQLKASSISEESRDKFIPLSGEHITVTCRASDADGISSVYVIASFYDSTVIDTVMMNNDSLDYYSCILQSKNNGCRTEYLIYAVNTLGDTTASDLPGRFFWGYTSIPKLKEIDSSGYPRYFGYAIRSTGIVTTETGTFTTGNNIINFQQNYILGAVIKTESTEPHCLVGDSITAEGTIGMWSGQTRIEPPNSQIILHSSGHSLDTIFLTADELMDTVGEDYEGLLTMIDCYGIHDGNWPYPNQNAALWMKNDSVVSKGDICDTFLMWCDKDTDLDGSDEPGWHERIVGIVSQYDTEAPYFSGYQMMPRAYADVSTGMSTALSGCHISYYLNNGIHLKWHIENRCGLSFLRIERKQSKSIHFDILAELGPDESTYHDASADTDNSYTYRLRGVYSDGRIIEMNSLTVDYMTDSDIAMNIETVKDLLILDIKGLEASNLSLALYNAAGQCIESIECSEPGSSVRIYQDISKVPSGVYFVVLKSSGADITRRFNIIR